MKATIDLIEEAVTGVMPGVAEYAIDRIGQIVDTKLHRTARAYKMGLSAPESVVLTGRRLQIQLTTPISQALETGFDAFDMKAALLSSGAAKQGKNGPYMDVPFRHGVEKNAVNLQGMPSTIKKKVEASVRRERRIAKQEGRPFSPKLRVTKTLPAAQGLSRNLRLGSTTQRVPVQHKTSIYSDLMATTFKRGKSTGRTYNTIRRISRKSDAAAWWHPGFEGVHALPQVQRQATKVAKKLAIQALAKIGIKAK